MYSASCSGYTSEQITARVTSITGITLSSNTDVVTSNKTITLTAEIGGTYIQPNTPVTVTGDITGTYGTDDYGRVSFMYTGDGTGDKTVTATVGEYSDSILIEDLLYYLKRDSEYQDIRGNLFKGSAYKGTSTWSFKIPDNGRVAYGVGDGTYTGDYELSMIIGGDSNNLGIYVGAYWMSGTTPKYHGYS